MTSVHIKGEPHGLDRGQDGSLQQQVVTVKPVLELSLLEAIQNSSRGTHGLGAEE